MFDRWKSWARRLKRDIAVLAIAARDPRTPWHLKLIGAALVAYALSPIDLIPDFIPVLGLLDDLFILPVGIWFVLRRLPPGLLADYRERAETVTLERRWIAAFAVIAIWALAAAALWYWFAPDSLRP